jgi:predicted RecB family nuclease
VKRKISAREAVVDIRSGKSDADLMDKYRLTATGLQSLFDKLVSAGYLDLSEVQGRIASFVGTVVIPQPDSLREEGTFSDDGHADRKTKQILINAQEAARDIRLRMSDSSLMEKHRLSAKGLQSMFNKLITVGIITQADLDARYSDADHTVDLKEQMPTLTQVLAHW